MIRTLAILSSVFISFTAYSQPLDYTLQLEEAQLKLSDLAAQCDQPGRIQSLSSGQKDTQNIVLQIRCNITLPIDKIQAIEKFPRQLSNENGSKLQLEYSANKGAFIHTLHVALVAMKGFQTDDALISGRGIVINRNMNLSGSERFAQEQELKLKIVTEIRSILSQSKELITGKYLANVIPVKDGKFLLPVTPDILLEIIHKYPKRYGIKSVE